MQLRKNCYREEINIVVNFFNGYSIVFIAPSSCGFTFNMVAFQNVDKVAQCCPVQFALLVETPVLPSAAGVRLPADDAEIPS